MRDTSNHYLAYRYYRRALRRAERASALALRALIAFAVVSPVLVFYIEPLLPR